MSQCLKIRECGYNIFALTLLIVQPALSMELALTKYSVQQNRFALFRNIDNKRKAEIKDNEGQLQRDCQFNLNTIARDQQYQIFIKLDNPDKHSFSCTCSYYRNIGSMWHKPSLITFITQPFFLNDEKILHKIVYAMIDKKVGISDDNHLAICGLSDDQMQDALFKPLKEHGNKIERTIDGSFKFFEIICNILSLKSHCEHIHHIVLAKQTPFDWRVEQYKQFMEDDKRIAVNQLQAETKTSCSLESIKKFAAFRTCCTFGLIYGCMGIFAGIVMPVCKAIHRG